MPMNRTFQNMPNLQWFLVFAQSGIRCRVNLLANSESLPMDLSEKAHESIVMSKVVVLLSNGVVIVACDYTTLSNRLFTLLGYMWICLENE